jgi:hypothetical protein
MFFDLACTVEAKDIFVWTPTPGTYNDVSFSYPKKKHLTLFIYVVHTFLGDATVVTRVVAGEAPIPSVLLYVQHLCLPVIWK